MKIEIAPAYSTVEELAQLWQKVRSELLEFLLPIQDEKFTESFSEHWSIAATAEHLYLSQRVTVLSINKAKNSAIQESTPESVDYEKLQFNIVNGARIKNPDVVQPGKLFSKTEILYKLKVAEDNLLKSLKEERKDKLTQKSVIHPFAGKLNLFDFIWVMILHEYRHLKIMKERTPVA